MLLLMRDTFCFYKMKCHNFIIIDKFVSFIFFVLQPNPAKTFVNDKSLTF